MKYILILALFPVCCSAFERWGSVDIAGYYYSDAKAEYTRTIKPGGKWFINSGDDHCLTSSNRCFASYNSRLYFHGEKGINGDGVLLVSKEIKFTSGITIEAELDAYCGGPCWANIGIYRGEGNYRAFGFNEYGAANTMIWGPISYAYVDKGYRRATYKISYWFDGNRWRWDYFINNIWVAGHFSEDYEYKMGHAYFADNKARIEIGFGGHSPGSYAEGYIGEVKVLAH